MLSKLEFFDYEASPQFEEINWGALINLLDNFFIRLNRKVVFLNNFTGTLGQLFKIDEDGVVKFIKTHIGGEKSKNNLMKEFALLSYLYGSSVALEDFELDVNGMTFYFCIFSELAVPDSEPSVDDILNLQKDYHSKLRGLNPIKYLAKEYTLVQIVERAVNTADWLFNQNFISKYVYRKINQQISLIKEVLPSIPLILCHGDLGPNNIMCYKSKLVAMDWEDSFWGFEGYDYIYWLSFFSNRKYYGGNIFNKTFLGKKHELALMATIVLLKCRLSVLMNSYKNNQISFNQRMSEIFDLE